MGGCLSCKDKKKRNNRKSLYSAENQSEGQKALKEIVETERAFGQDLKCLVDYYLEPLRTEAVFFDNTDLMLLNSICLDLAQIQGKFQKTLESHTENLNDRGTDLSDVIFNVGDDLLMSVKDFDIFAKYVVAMSRVQKVIGDKSEGNTNENIVKFLEKRMESIQSQSDEPTAEHFLKNEKILTMESLLLKPFQRMMLYPLLLERLEKITEEGTSDRDQVSQAITSLKAVCTQMNDALKKDEENGDAYKTLLKEYGIAEYSQKKL